jgi:hypothetical protein
VDHFRQARHREPPPGLCPSIKWWTPAEQRVAHALVAPFIAAGGSVITRHWLDVMILYDTEQNMIIREKRGAAVIEEPPLTFHTNTSNPDYIIASREYENSDDVMI